MAKKKATEPQQIVDGLWYALAHGKPPHTEECCDCGLVHTVDYKVENGVMWARWTVNDGATAEARKRRKITREVQTVKRKERTSG